MYNPVYIIERYHKLPSHSPTLVAVYITLLMMNLFFYLPRRASRVLLAGFKVILQNSLVGEAIIQTIPKDPATVLDSYDLDPRTQTYISCPACHALYPYSNVDMYTGPMPGRTTQQDLHLGTHTVSDLSAITDPNIHSNVQMEHDNSGSAIPVCTHKSTPYSEPCGVPLWMKRRVGNTMMAVPIQKYLHQDMKQWMGWLLARPGVEDILDSADKPDAKEPYFDIWDTPAFRTFLDTNGIRFSSQRQGEGRYIFSLAVDGFNPFHMKEAKQQATSTGIYMVLMNFPPHLWFLPENMFLVGVVPGPGKPSLDEINHSLHLIC